MVSPAPRVLLVGGDGLKLDGVEVQCVADRDRAVTLLGAVDVVLVEDLAWSESESLLERAMTDHGDVLRLVRVPAEHLDAVERAMHRGLVHRYVLTRDGEGARADMVRWGLEVGRLRGTDPQLAERFVETERMASLGRITAGLFHDLRTAVSFVMYGTASLEGIADRCPPEEREELDEVRHELEAGCEVIRKLIEANQALWRGTGDVDNRTDDPAQAIKASLRVCEATLRHKGARLRYDGPDSLPTVAGSEAHLMQVLINLLTNATHGFEGWRLGGLVTVTADYIDEQVQIVVSDNGRGMDVSAAAEAGGLGLSQCRRFVELAGGRLEIDSTRGSGTRVSFSLPAIVTPEAVAK